MLAVKPIQTKIFHPNDDFDEFLLKSTQDIPLEGQILAVTSKIVSLAENRLVKRQEIDKSTLIKKEADQYLGEIGYGCHLTVKHGRLIASAGIDESNSETDDFILYPLDPFASALRIYQLFKTRLSLHQFGVLITDSHTLPLRQGVEGMSLAHHGFKGLNSKVGSLDLFGRPLRMTQINVADALAAAATLTMGEGDDLKPLAVVHFPVEFTETSRKNEMSISLEEDLYSPLLLALGSGLDIN